MTGIFNVPQYTVLCWDNPNCSDESAKTTPAAFNVVQLARHWFNQGAVRHPPTVRTSRGKCPAFLPEPPYGEAPVLLLYSSSIASCTAFFVSRRTTISTLL